MDEQNLQKYLGNRPFRFYASTESTMLDAVRWLDENPELPTGAVIIADEQRQGKGRLKRGWLTPPGTAVAMSVIFRGEIPPEQLPILGGMAVAETLDSYAEDVALKWPNDVMIAGKKVCGVLAESLWEGDHMRASILGMGINISVDFSATELDSKATSLIEYMPENSSIDRAAIIAAVLNRMDAWLMLLEAHARSQYAGIAPSPLYLAWKKRLITLGQDVQVSTESETIAGKALDVDSDGALIVQLADGEKRRFLAGDVTLSG